MKKALLSLLLLCAALPAPLRAQSAAPAASYDRGMELRRAGDYAAARENFLELLRANPASGGALEGLALSCMSLKLYGEARGALDKWNTLNPHNAYVLGLLARVQNSQGDYAGALETYAELAALDPRDCASRRRMDSYSAGQLAGVLPKARTYRSYSLEGLNTSDPQRILYEGASGTARFQAPLGAGLDLIGEAGIREEAQRNDGRGFTYYDIQEQLYSAGLRGKAGRADWEAEYGRSIMTDLEGSAVGNRSFDRARLYGAARAFGADLSLTLNSQLRYVRGPGGSARYFELLRENSVRAEAGFGLAGWDWAGRAGLYHTSDGTGMASWSMRGSRESGPYLWQAGYSHGQQEFYSVSADGGLRYVNTDRLSAGLRRYSEDRYRAALSAGQTFYTDDNRLLDFGAELTGWLPWQKEFSAGYRFEFEDFLKNAGGYDSLDNRGHWLGAYWNRCRGYNWSASLGYEHGFLRDPQTSYQGDRYLAGLEWYAGRNGSVKLSGARKYTTARGHSWSLGLEGRITFR